MLQRNLAVLAIVAALVIPAALAAPKSGSPDDADAYVNENGDAMRGTLEMQGNAIAWSGEPLTSPSAGELTFGSERVCLSNGNCHDVYPVYTAGDGLVLAGTTFALVACGENEVLKVSAGAWACGADVDTDTDTTYSAGDGLTLDATTFSLLGCAEGQILKMGAGSWACGQDVDTDTDTDTDTLAALACADGEVAKFAGGAWACAADVGAAGTSVSWNDLVDVPATLDDGVDNVDGGNAALLDGLGSWRFLRSDAAAHHTGPSFVVDGNATAGNFTATGGRLVLEGDGGPFSQHAVVEFGSPDRTLEWAIAVFGTWGFHLSDPLVVHGVLEADERFTLWGDAPTIEFGPGLSGMQRLSFNSEHESFNVTNDVALAGNLSLFPHRGYFPFLDPEDGDQQIEFFDAGEPNGERFQWDDSEDRFEISDDLHVFGDISSSSTVRLKTNVAELQDALALVLQLRGVSYDRIEDGRHEIGFLAEDVVRVIPEVVVLDEEGLPAGIDYSRLVAVLIAAMQEQEARIVALESQQESMLSRLERLEAAMADD